MVGNGSNTGGESRDAVEADVATAEEFQAALARLLERGASNGVDVRGGWPVDGEVTTAPEQRADGWDVEVTALSREQH
ncbi:MAG: hypothetical protein ABEJ42_08560 [Halobacteriaceae archaeon]